MKKRAEPTNDYCLIFKKNKVYKRRIILLFIMSSMGLSFGQEDDLQFDYSFENELKRMISVPDSPEAYAFKQYGNTEVDLFKGSQNISIPIYNFKGKELEIPISLTYDPFYLKVDQLASSVGLGWNLNVGGRITRNVMGAADDYSSGGVSSPYNNTGIKETFLNVMDWHLNGFDSLDQFPVYYSFLEDIEKNNVEVNPDTYSLSVNGLNTTIIIDNNNQAKSLDNPLLKIEFKRSGNNSILKWKITDGKGTVYFFDHADKIDLYDHGYIPGNGNFIATYNSSWLVTKIVSPLEKDVFEFNYSSTTFSNPRPISAGSKSYKINVNNYNGTQILVPLAEVWSTREYNSTNSNIQTIKYNGANFIVFNYENNRDDISISDKLNSIKILSPLEKTIKYVNFEYDYFGLGENETIENKRPEDIKLRLDAVKFKSNALDLESENYNFTYNSPEDLPSIDSKSRDIYGYYNGKGNRTLLPKMQYGMHFIPGANRDFSFQHATKGILKSIKYPTGGFTNFQYEQAVALENQIVYSTVFSLLSPSSSYNPIDYQDSVMPFNGDLQTDVFYNSDEINITINLNKTHSIYGSTLVDDTVLIKITKFDIDPSITGSQGVEVLLSSSGIPNTFSFESEKWYKIGLKNRTKDNTLNRGEVSLKFIKKMGVLADVYYPTYRVSKITDYSNVNILERVKTISYSGLIFNSKPDISYEIFKQMHLSNNGHIFRKLFVHQLANPFIKNEPIVIYNTVSENYVSKTDPDQSYKTKYVFNTFGDSTPYTYLSATGSYTNYIENPIKGKIIKTNVFDENLNLLKETNTLYEKGLLNNYVGLTTERTQDRTFQVPYAKLMSTGKYNIRYLEKVWAGFGGSPTINTPSQYTPPRGCYDNTYNCLHAFDPNIGSRLTLISSSKAYLKQKKVLEKFDNSELNTQVNYIYDSYSLLKKSYSFDSNNNKINKKYFYPYDTELQSLIDSNRLEEVVKTEITKEDIDGNILSKQVKKYDYQLFGNNKTLVNKIQTLKGEPTATNTLEPRIIYHDYDDFGNPLEVSKTDGTHIVYIWGYNHSQPIAKIENATYAQVLSHVPNLQTKSNTDTHRSVDTIAENGVKIYANDSEGNLREALDGLRDTLPNALVTTYTYDPLIGVTSMTDPRGSSVYYDYDGFNRLKHVKDQDGNILSKSDYKYRPQN